VPILLLFLLFQTGQYDVLVIDVVSYDITQYRDRYNAGGYAVFL